MFAHRYLALTAVSTLLASRCILAAPLPANSPPHGRSPAKSPSHERSRSPSPEPGSPRVEWHDSGKKTHEKLLITSTDGKFDDKLGMTANERIGKYGDHDIHHNGVVDVEGSHAHMHDWFKHMDAAGKGKFHSSKRKFYHGGTPFIKNGKPDPAAHEHLFRDDKRIDMENVPPLKKIKMEDPHPSRELEVHRGKHADYFSMAPIPEKEFIHQMKAYSDAGVTIDNAVHVEGYNSRQDIASRRSASKETANFVKNMRGHVRKFHPKANVVLTHSKHNFGENGQGATQPYEDLLGRAPFPHVQTVGEKDHFAINQIKTAEQYIQDAGEQPHIVRGADDKEPITHPETWQARRNKHKTDPNTMKLRHNMITGIDANLPKLTNDHIKHRLRSVRSGVVDGCQGETCDANHVILAHQAMREGAAGFDNVHVDDKIQLSKPMKGQEHHAITPKLHANNKARVTKELKEHFPIVDHDAFKEIDGQ